MKTMKDYHDLYLKWDVLLLAKVFLKNRKNSIKNYELCSSHYFSGPALSWDAILKMAKVKLKLISDPDIYIFFKKIQEAEFLIFLIDIVNPKISILNLMDENKNQNILYT